MAYDIDVVVVGAGPGGYVAAIRAAQLGLRVALVDKAEVGGVCLNCGCIPSKALIHAAHVLHQMQTAAKMGIHATGITHNMAETQTWKQGVIQRMVNGIMTLLKHHKVQLIKGTGTFTGPHTLQIASAEGSQTLSFASAIVATGSASIAIPSLQGSAILSSTEALELQTIPEHFAVVGGGYIGLEIGGFLQQMGSQVTVVEMMDKLLPAMDPDCVRVVERQFKKQGGQILTQTKALGYADGYLQVETPQGPQAIRADQVLVAVGRRPNTRGLGLEAAGVTVQDNGLIATDLQMRTTVPHIYAIGDIVAGPMLAHKASREGLIAAEAIAGKPSARDFKVIPAVMFTDPELASVGMTEAEAKAAGYQVKTSRFPFAALGKAVASNAPEGLVKVVANADNGLILGVHMVGAEVSNLIAEAALAIEMGAVAQDLALTVHAHPTLAEALMEACEGVYGHAVHAIG
jgi:dihydrolipoamide dehydrogenase